MPDKLIEEIRQGKVEKRSKKLELYKSLLAKKKEKGLNDLFFFNKYIVEQNPKKRKNLVPHVHGEWTDWHESSDARIKMILVPRGSFKSTFFTVRWTMQLLCQDRDKRILIANATANNARKFLSEIKDELRLNEEVNRLYGDFYDKDLKWNEDEFDVKGRSPGIRESAVTAVGAGGNLVSQHYDVIIGDDLVNDENSATKLQSDKIIDWWKKSLSLLEPSGEYLIIGTRWSYYELYSYLLDKFSGDIDTYIASVYNDDGSMYFPERYDEEKLQELKKLHGSYFFSAFYLNDPVDEESALIKKSQIQYYGKNEPIKKPQGLKIFATCDPAVSQKTDADYSSIVIVGVDVNDDWYVLEVRRGKWTVGRLIDELFSVHKRWEPETMTIEVIGQSQGLMNPINRQEERLHTYLPLVEIKSRPQVTKERRIRSTLQPRFEQGKVFIKRSMVELEDELLTFPRGRHDDIVDALADIDEISYQPAAENEQTKGEKTLTKLENKLKYGNTRKVIDPIMGEHF